jgi:hypothetical protein
MRHKSRRSGLLLLAATATALGLVGGIASATKPLHVVSVEYGLGGHRPGIEYRVDGYRPKPVPAEELPDYHNYVTPLKGTQPINAQGVALWPVNDRKVYHPLVIARYAIQMLHSYRVTKMNPAYLDRAEVNANWLIKHAVSRDGALYFPYRFTYHLCGDPHDVLRPPWFSALPQGTALALFMRLYALTGDQHWRTAADSTFATFVKRQSPKQPWIVPWIVFIYHPSHRGYLWLEEAPKHPPDQVLNGFMYASSACGSTHSLPGATPQRRSSTVRRPRSGTRSTGSAFLAASPTTRSASTHSTRPTTAFMSGN